MKINVFVKKALTLCLFVIIIACVLCVSAAAEGECDGHVSNVWVIDPENTPSCTEGGYMYKVCDKCGEKFDVTEAGALGHVAPEEYVVVDATCQKTGEMYKNCEECGEKIESITLEVTSHLESDWLKNVNKPVTCTNDGEEYIECVHCKEVLETRSITSSGHKMIVNKAVDSTCTKNGHTEGKVCVSCGLVEVQYEVIPAGHKGETVLPAVKATKDAEGLTEGKMCTACGEILVAQQVLPKVSYLWLNIVIAVVGALLVAGIIVLVVVKAVKKGKKIAEVAESLIENAEAESTSDTSEVAEELVEEVAEEATETVEVSEVTENTENN